MNEWSPIPISGPIPTLRARSFFNRDGLHPNLPGFLLTIGSHFHKILYNPCVQLFTSASSHFITTSRPHNTLTVSISPPLGWAVQLCRAILAS